MLTKKSAIILPIVTLIGNLGFSSVAQADLKWVEANGKRFCPDVCQHYTKNYKIAVPSGIHPKTGKTYYICAVNYGLGDIGWRTGYNIAWRKDVCYAQWHKYNSGKGSYDEHFFCLCSNQQFPPITNDMLRR